MDIELSEELQQVMTIIETAMHDKVSNLFELLQSALDEHIFPQSKSTHLYIFRISIDIAKEGWIVAPITWNHKTILDCTWGLLL